MPKIPNTWLYVLLLGVILLDCYADDILGAAGIPSEIIFGLSSSQIGVYLVTWVGLIALHTWVLIQLHKRIRIGGALRWASIALIIFALSLTFTNHLVRIHLTVKAISDKMEVPAFFFIETYCMRLTVYLAVALVCLLILTKIWRSSGSLTIRIASYLMVISTLIAALTIFWGGVDILTSSPYWSGESITHRNLYMGSLPRDMAHQFEPAITFMFILGLGMIGAGFMGVKWRERPWIIPAAVLFLVIFIQIIPRLHMVRLTEAFFTTDFYYAFRLDRSISFPCLPVMILFLSTTVARVLRNLKENPFQQVKRILKAWLLC